jgi:HD-GYP domain-containing protein (c-di-GMP phosphodiesterase class II)
LTQKHVERVAHISAALADAADWSTARIARLCEAALLHDVGKIGVPDAVLLKPGTLTDTEYDQVKAHAALGALIAQEVPDPEQARWVRGHHERPDGRGYPDGLSGQDMPDGARLLALADAYDAITSHGPTDRRAHPTTRSPKCAATAAPSLTPTRLTHSPTSSPPARQSTGGPDESRPAAPTGVTTA